MPVTTPGRVRRRGRARALLVTGVAGVVAAAALVGLVVQFAARSPDRVELGPRVFNVGRADRLARRIEADGPLLFKDALNRGREIYVHHTGREGEEGWIAFEAYGPRAPHTPECVLEWDSDDGRFRDPCGDASYPPTGTGLVHYEATVEDGIVVVDLNRRRSVSPAQRLAGLPGRPTG